MSTQKMITALEFSQLSQSEAKAVAELARRYYAKAADTKGAVRYQISYHGAFRYSIAAWDANGKLVMDRELGVQYAPSISA